MFQYVFVILCAYVNASLPLSYNLGAFGDSCGINHLDQCACLNQFKFVELKLGFGLVCDQLCINDRTKSSVSVYYLC